jgi:uncharacterized protein (TIGR02301 family)
MSRFLVLAAIAAAVCVEIATAQPAAAPRSDPRRAEAQNRAEQLTELAQVMGRAHYLRILCAGRGEQRWRMQMQKLLEVEGKGFARAGLVEAFNAGFRTEEERFPECSPTVEAAERDLMAQGRRLTDGLAAPYRAQ